jgi:hypothetical protein
MCRKLTYLSFALMLALVLGIGEAQADIADIAEGLAGLWEFDNPGNLTEATVGNDLILVGIGQSAVTGMGGSDGAVAVDLGTYYQCDHGIAANGGGGYVNEFTLLFDVMYPEASAGTWRAFYQTGYDTYNDSEYFINPSNESWGLSALGYTDNAAVGEWYSSHSTWYRVVLTVNLDNDPGAAFHDLYINGELKGKHDTGGLGVDGRFSLYASDDENPYLVLCGDDNGEDALMHFSNIAIWGRPLTSAEIAELGGPDLGPTALAPQPPDGATEVMTDENLSWSAGAGAVSHDVYFGTDKADVAAGTGGTSQGNQTTTSFEPGTLQVATTYYWRIDEKASDNSITPGEVWSFTTAEYRVVDDFEAYNDLDPADPESNPIYVTWEDGLLDPANGSQVGYLTVPSVETEIVHGGAQSMPFLYDNSTAAYSEAVRTFDTSEDFTASGLVGLTLWYQGQPTAVGSLSFDAGTYTMTGSGADIGGNSDEFHYAFNPLTGNGSIAVRVDSLTDTHSWAKAGVMIRETLDPDSLFAMVAVTPSGRVAFEFRITEGQTTQSTHTAADAVTLPHWVRLTRSGNNLFTAEHSANGVNWVPVESGDLQDPSTWNVLMNPDVHVGLAVTAHDDQATCEATFSNVTVNPPGLFTQSQDVGIGSNTPAPLYLRLEDDAGTPSTVYHEDGSDAVLNPDWQVWAISLEDFQADGVDVTAVKKIVIGVGDKDNPQPGGPGKLFVDDIWVVRRMPAVGKVLLFEEDFDSLVLGPSVDEDDAPADNEAWTETPPAGWVVDDSGVPGAGDPANDGATEWAGWSFAKKDWWAQIGQDRELFDLASGIVAVADPDEWDDFGHPPGLMNALLSTPEIDHHRARDGHTAARFRFELAPRRHPDGQHYRKFQRWRPH